MSEYSYSAEDYDNSDMAQDWGSDQIGGWDTGTESPDVYYGNTNTSDQDLMNQINQMGTNDLWSSVGQQNLTPWQQENSVSGLTTDGQGYDFSGGINNANYVPQGMDFGGALGGASNFLSQLFGSGGALGGKGGQGLVAGLGALMEGRQNKKQAQGMQQVVQQQQQRTSPFDVQSTGASQMGANSMRDAMQQKLAAAMQDPYSAPIVKSQVQQIQKAQAIKDAAAGRRSNSSTSDPAMMAAQAKVAQEYINSLQNPAGANINPNSQGLEALLQAQRNNTNGYASPIMSALGYNASVNTARNNQQSNIPPELMAKFEEWYKGQR